MTIHDSSTSLVAVLLADASGRITTVGDTCSSIFGTSKEDLIGNPFTTLLVEPRGKPLREELQKLQPGRSLSWELTARRADGATFACELTAVRTQSRDSQLVLIFQDVTLTRELQEQLLQREKLSSLGQLISGVAHELNNPLTCVLGFSQLAMGHPNCPEKVRRDLTNVFNQAQRCEKIVQNLLSFARKHKPEKRWIGINGVLESTVALLDYQLRVSDIEVVMDLDPNLPKTMADYHQLQQVFLNLITNAQQAIEMAGKGGHLHLRTRSCGNRLRIEIADDGPGIPEKVLHRVFEPFFTTKPSGAGTGLGLSICYGVISEHGGCISAHSPGGRGTTFVLELPVLAPETSEEARPQAASQLPAHPGRRNLLVVDDEEIVLDLLFEVLTAEGHRVDIARGGMVSLRKMEKEAYDLLITDMRMPGCDGPKVLERWQRLYPERARSVLVITGDLENPETREFIERSGLRYMTKPFQVGELEQTVRSILNEAAA